MNVIAISIFRIMHLLSGVYQIFKESVTHPFEDTVLADTGSHYVPVRKGTDLTNANLEGANLEEANLEGSILRGANLTNANFKNANLRRVDFTGAIIKNTNFEGADTTGAIGLSI